MHSFLGQKVLWPSALSTAELRSLPCRAQGCAGQQMGGGAYTSSGQSAAIQTEVGHVCHQAVSAWNLRGFPAPVAKLLLRTQQNEGKFLLAH